MSNPSGRIGDVDKSDEINLADIFRLILSNIYLLIFIISVFLFLGVIYAVMATPVYTANSLVQVEDASPRFPSLSEATELFGGGSVASDTEISIIKSRMVLGNVVNKLGLDISVSPNYFPIIGDFLYRKNSNSLELDDIDGSNLSSPFLGLSSYAWGGESIKVDHLDVPRKFLGKELKLIFSKDKEFSLYDDEENKVLSGSVGEYVISNGFSIKITDANIRDGSLFKLKKLSYITAVKNLRGNLTVSEKGKDSGIISISVKNTNPVLASNIVDNISSFYIEQNMKRSSVEAENSLKFLEKKIPEFRRTLEAHESELNEFQRKNNSIDIELENKALLELSVNIESELSKLKLKKLEMDRRFTPQHPLYKSLVKQIEELSSKKNEINGIIESLPETQQKLLRLSRDVEVGNEVYMQMLNASQELDIVKAGTVGNVRLIDSAIVDINSPVHPNKKLIVLGSLFLGGIIALGFIFIRHILNPGLQRSEDIQSELGMPVYANIPLSPHQIKKKEDTRLLSVTHPEDLSVEAMKGLRTSLHFAMMEAENNALMISGPTPGIGKSFISSNLAFVTSQTDKKILLIDADMRRGHLHKELDVSAKYGLSEILSGQSELNESIVRNVFNEFDFIYRGEIPPNPSELIMHKNFSDLLDAVKNSYDLVIIDTPPVLAVTDPILIGHHVGAVLLVVRFEVSSIKELAVSVDRFNQSGIDIKGCIFNGIKSGLGYYGYNYNYNYNYN